MQISFELTLPFALDVLSFSTALVLGLLFMTSKTNNRKANVFLGLFLWSLSIEVFESFIQPLEGVELIKTSLFTIPFLFYYINQTLNKKIIYKCLFLFLPGILLNIFMPNITVLKYLEYVFNISILLYILKTLKNHQEKVNNFYSDLENKTLSWIKAIVFIFLLFHLLWIVEDLVGLQDKELIDYFAYTSTFLTFFMIYWIGYNGFSQPEMFMSPIFISFEKKDPLIDTDISKTVTLFLEISAKIQQQKLFTKTDLNLHSLSIQLNLKERELSKLINTHTQKNFYHYINQFRVDEFKNLLSSPKAKQLSILGLAEEAGFSSKSTFYTVFKKLEGITPKQFQLSQKKSD